MTGAAPVARSSRAHRGSIVIAGGVARRPNRGGHAWAFLQYVLGFRRLGWDVLFVDSVDGGSTRAVNPREVAWFRSLVRMHGLEDDAVLLAGATDPLGDGASLAGPPRRDVIERIGRADLFLNVMGYVRDEEILAAARRRVFLDIDPGFPQLWQDLGLARPCAGHDAYATVGLRVGRPDCLVPTLGLDWICTPPPVVLEQFPFVAPAGGAFTSVCTWRGPFGPVEHGGRSFGLRVHEFRRFSDLPTLTAARFEIALDIDDADAADRERLRRAGWILRDPVAEGGDTEAYRRFIAGSAAEIGIAKGLYVDTRGGWFSDRSVCYLASGRPVVSQETGWSDALPTGEGLLAFTDLDDAVEAIAEVRASPRRHGRAARDLAAAFFDSDLVLPSLAERAAASPFVEPVGASTRPGSAG